MSMLRDENGKLSTSRILGLAFGGTLVVLALATLWCSVAAPEYVFKALSSVIIALAVHWGVRTGASNFKGGT